MGSGNPELLAEMETVGRALLGSPGRFRLGIWIAGLPGNPRTFSVLEYWAFCRDAGWPGAGRPIGTYMRRFENLEMVRLARPARGRGGKALWTKLPSPAWQLFEALDPWRRAHQPKITLADLTAQISRFDLLRLRGELAAGGEMADAE